MKPTTKIRFTEPQIALLMRAHPDCNLDGLIELTFFFDQNGHLIDCTGKIEGDDAERDYAGLGLILTYEMARRWSCPPPPEERRDPPISRRVGCLRSLGSGGTICTHRRTASRR
jgi:hypothetical protein